MTRLSVNINKVATLRNARGGNIPDVTKAALDCERFGAEGITVHPRPDERHIRYSDVRIIRPLVTTEFNIEGNPIPSFVDLVDEVVPDQVTLVPDAHDAITSNAGWDTLTHKEFLTDICKEFKAKAANLNKKGYETMVNSNEDNEKTLILVKTKGDVISEMVILALEPSECSLIQLKGKFSSNDINGLQTSFN